MSTEFLKEIELDVGQEKLITVAIEYPWIPVKCSKCQAFGHPSYACMREERRVWKPKKFVD